jgi:hypothetical protein
MTQQPASAVRFTPAAPSDDPDEDEDGFVLVSDTMLQDFIMVNDEMLQELALQQDPASLFYRATSDGVTHVRCDPAH